MFRAVDTNNPAAVEAESQSIFRELFTAENPERVSCAFGWAVACFRGQYQDYQPIDARYHDLEHTLQGTLCLMRLLGARQRAKAPPPLTAEMFELALLAILLHDTGYLKTKDDQQGTGAKYTSTHVRRSTEFARALLTEKGFTPAQILSVQNMIRCTGVNVDLEAIPFQNEPERIAGFALSTADLLGQMAAPDYISKLPILYEEFAESAAFNRTPGAPGNLFSSPEDLMRKTPAFWENYVKPKIERDYQGLYRFLNNPFPDGPNPYLVQIEANIGRLRQQLTARG